MKGARPAPAGARNSFRQFSGLVEWNFGGSVRF